MLVLVLPHYRVLLQKPTASKKHKSYITEKQMEDQQHAATQACSITAPKEPSEF
jgi:hypothetical protein